MGLEDAKMALLLFVPLLTAAASRNKGGEGDEGREGDSKNEGDDGDSKNDDRDLRSEGDWRISVLT